MEYTKRDAERQDYVDNSIHSFLEDFLGVGVMWDIENIGIIRDALEEVVVNKLRLMNRKQFYP